MSFISIFDVLGPNMVGPSSSHTAGACSIGLMARKLLGEPAREVEFILYGSFAKTYKGHGTDRALLGGIMVFPQMTYASQTHMIWPANRTSHGHLSAMRLRRSSTPIQWTSI